MCVPSKQRLFEKEFESHRFKSQSQRASLSEWETRDGNGQHGHSPAWAAGWAGGYRSMVQGAWIAIPSPDTLKIGKLHLGNALFPYTFLLKALLGFPAESWPMLLCSPHAKSNCFCQKQNWKKRSSLLHKLCWISGSPRVPSPAWGPWCGHWPHTKVYCTIDCSASPFPSPPRRVWR